MTKQMLLTKTFIHNYSEWLRSEQ